MKIDLHVHTKKIKKGESEKRNVDKETFLKKMEEGNVSIVAITNHNHFDISQFNEFSKNDREVMVWPGVELDVVGENNSKWHCIVITDPKLANKFNSILESLLKNKSSDDFVVSVKDLISNFSKLEIILMPHYKKNPEISTNDLKNLREEIKDLKNIILCLEVPSPDTTNIFSSHYSSETFFNSSDIQDWEEYHSRSKTLPELKYEIDNFESFFKLVKKDPVVVKTIMDRAQPKKIDIEHYGKKLSFLIYKDINIIFGAKATGKSEILKSIYEKFKNDGEIKTSKYFHEDVNETIKNTLKPEIVENHLTHFETNDMSSEFAKLKSWTEISPTKTSEYYDWAKNKKATNFGFERSSFNWMIDEEKFPTEFSRYLEIKKSFENLSKQNIKDFFIENKDKDEFNRLSEMILNESWKKVINEFCNYKGLILEKYTIEKMKNLIKLKKMHKANPQLLGWLNYLKIEWK